MGRGAGEGKAARSATRDADTTATGRDGKGRLARGNPGYVVGTWSKGAQKGDAGIDHADPQRRLANRTKGKSKGKGKGKRWIAEASESEKAPADRARPRERVAVQVASFSSGKGTGKRRKSNGKGAGAVTLCSAAFPSGKGARSVQHSVEAYGLVATPAPSASRKGKGQRRKSMAQGKGTCSRRGAAAPNGKGIRSPERYVMCAESTDMCAICQEEINGPWATLDCMHAFHHACGLRCMPHIRRAGCPICRTPAPLWLRQFSPPDERELASDIETGGWELDAVSDSDMASDVELWYAHDEISSGFGLEDPSVVEREPSWSLDFYDDLERREEIERLHEEYPGLDSDALEDLCDARIQDDCDEFGGYCSGGS